MRGVLKHLVVGTIVAASVGACGGGGCTSCSGVTPLPGGFEPDARIENAAAIRITDGGFTFIEDNLGQIASGLLGSEGGALTFPIDTSTGEIDVFLGTIDYTICPDGPTDNPLTCTVEIDVAAFDLDFAPNGPHHLSITGPIPLRLQQLPLDTDLGGGDITLSGNRVCPGEGPTFAAVDATIRISLETDVDPTHARQGYSRLRIEEVSINTDQITDQIALCGDILLDILDVDFIRGFVVDQVAPGLVDTLRSSLEEQLCQASNPDVSPPCPTGTNDIEGICRYGTDAESECVSTVLGTDGHAELGSLLSSISPGTEGGLDFLLAAGGAGMREDGGGLFGDLDPIGGGATLGMFGGVEPRPVSQCVPLSTLPMPTGIPIPDELRLNTVPGWPAGFPRPGSVGPDLGIAISEDFFNYSLAGMYNSGLLCLGITTETIGDVLNTGTVGIFAASLRDLTLQRENAPIAIVLRPTTAPRVAFGNGTDLATDPNLLINLDALAFDFYIWSSDRFIRVFTAQFDLEVPANLEITPEGLLPVIQDIGVNNGRVENSELLSEDPQALADALGSLISGQVGSLLAGGIPAIDISGALDSYGLRLGLPPSQPGQGSAGVRKLTKGAHDYLGIFAGLESIEAQPSFTSAWVVRKVIEKGALRAETASRTNVPSVILGAESDLDGEVEFQAKVDNGPWKPFVRGHELEVRDEAFRVEGKHTVLVRGRAVGAPYSLSEEPARVEVLVDTVAPDLIVTRDEDGQEIEIDAFDVVTEASDLEIRLVVGDVPRTWQPLDEVAPILSASDLGLDSLDGVTLEVRDEGGNVATASHAIIRGAARDTGDSGCSCEVPGARTASGKSGFAGLAAVTLGGLAMALRARRRRGLAGLLDGGRALPAAAALVTVVGTAASPGCDCGDSDPSVTTSSTGAGGNGGGGPSCTDCEVLEPGIIGNYASAALDADGTIWVAGYAEANWGQSYQWGDLVVGPWDGEKVEWELVDGVPSEPEVDPSLYDTSSFRGGQIVPGDDVGLWTSTAIDGNGKPAVAYYDRTNRQLKLARLGEDGWSVDVVEEAGGGDVGRYAELWFEGTTAVVAYQAFTPAPTGFVTSKVRIARAGSTGGFQYEDVAVEPNTPCSGTLCSSGSVCVADTGQCAATTTGCAECGADQECVTGASAPECVDVKDDKALQTYPNGTGLYITSAKDPGGQVGLAWYDRVAGTLVAARKSGGSWVTTVVDGGGSPPTDCGIGAALAIDGGGEWHLAYVDGYAEALKYARLAPDGSVASIEVVDEGYSAGGAPFADGKHIVGDDASIHVSGSGSVRIAYQDATAVKLRIATGSPNGAAHDWELTAIAGEGARGYFSEIVADGAELSIVSHYRLGKGEYVGDVEVVRP